MHSYASYYWLSIKQRQAGGVRKWVLVEADVRGGGIRDKPKERLRRRLVRVRIHFFLFFDFFYSFHFICLLFSIFFFFLFHLFVIFVYVLVANRKNYNCLVCNILRYRSGLSHLYRYDSLSLYKDIPHPSVFMNFLRRLRPVFAYT